MSTKSYAGFSGQPAWPFPRDWKIAKTLPASYQEIRDRYGWEPGSRLVVEDLGNGVLVRSTDLPETTVDDRIGCTGYDGPRQSLEDMEKVMTRGAGENR